VYLSGVAVQDYDADAPDQASSFRAALGLAAASCGGHPAPAASAVPASALTVKACTVDGLPARCGTLIVPEDRLTGQGRTIPVRLVVFPATGPDKAPDPVVYFAGGPGNSAFFPDSRDITLPGQGHDVNSARWAACAGSLTQTFIEQASLAHLNTSCLASVTVAPFDLTLQALAGSG